MTWLISIANQVCFLVHLRLLFDLLLFVFTSLEPRRDSLSNILSTCWHSNLCQNSKLSGSTVVKSSWCYICCFWSWVITLIAFNIVAGWYKTVFFSVSSEDDIKRAAATVAGIFIKEVDQLFEVYSCLDHDGSGLVGYKDICKIEHMSNADKLTSLSSWMGDLWSLTLILIYSSINFCSHLFLNKF